MTRSADGSATPAASLARGIVPLIAYAAMTAAVDVYAGNRFVHVSPAAVAAISFSAVSVFFAGVERLRNGPGLVHRLLPHRRDVLALNVTTAITWTATLYALEYLAPAVVNVIGVGLGPIITVVAGPVLRRDAVKVIAAEVVAAGGVCVVLGALVWLSFVGRSGLPDISAGHAAAGLVLTIICAVGSSLNIIYMKRLGEVGCSRGDVLASRFVLMTVLAWLLTAASHRGGVPAAVVPGIVVAVIGVGLPIYVLQLGIHYTEPITTSLVISLSPLFAFLLQLGDSRLSFSPSTLGGILIVLLLVSIGALVRHRQDLAVASSAPSRRHHSDHDSVRRGSEVTICAVVDAYGAGQLLPSALRRHGVDSVHVRSSNPDRRLSYRAEDFTIDIQQAGDVAATGAALREVGVDAIVAAAESGVTLADQLNQELGLAGNLIDRTSARRDKYAMQAAVQAAGLPIAGSIEVATSDAAVRPPRGSGVAGGAQAGTQCGERQRHRLLDVSRGGDRV